MSSRVSVVVGALLMATLVACSNTPQRRTQPEVPLPQDWAEGNPQAAAARRIASDWWRSFDSPELARLVDEALLASPDMAIATERVYQAELALRIVGSSLLPTVGAGAGSSRSRSDASEVAATTRESTSASLSVSYEVDVWGGLAADRRSARASLLGARYDLETVRLTLATSVASTYFSLLSTQARLAIARDNLATAERVLRIVDSRFRNGVVTSLDVAQQTTAVLAQRTALLPLELQVRQTRSALALLLGRVPQGFTTVDEDFNALTVPEIGADLPPSLLTRRPDLASAEASLAAAQANIASARAALLPGVSLSASGGLASAGLLSLSNPVSTASLALSLSQTLFDSGRRSAQLESVRSQQRVLVQNYETVVRAALKEVDDGLGNADVGFRQENAQRETLQQAQRTLRLAELRYREGTGDLLTVLDSQRTVFSAQDQLSQLRLTRLNAALDLYKALGGGWTPPVN